jgi:hypothetical protein
MSTPGAKPRNQSSLASYTLRTVRHADPGDPGPGAGEDRSSGVLKIEFETPGYSSLSPL